MNTPEEQTELAELRAIVDQLKAALLPDASGEVEPPSAHPEHEMLLPYGTLEEQGGRPVEISVLDVDPQEVAEAIDRALREPQRPGAQVFRGDENGDPVEVPA